MIAKQDPVRALLADDTLDECLYSVGRDYLAAIVRSADMLNAEPGAAMRARHDAYVTALAETVEASAWRVRGVRLGGRS